MSTLISIMALLNKLLVFATERDFILDFSKSLTEAERGELILFADNIEKLYKLRKKHITEDDD